MAEPGNELRRLAKLAKHELRVEWRRYFHREPPADMSRDLLVRTVAYKVQERGSGGLSQATKRLLHNLAEELRSGGPDAVLSLTPALKPGVRLVREWRGRTHSVLVLQDGFEYQGGRYRSLTEIARQITSAHWSGPRFFGVGWGAQHVGRISARGARGQAAGSAVYDSD